MHDRVGALEHRRVDFSRVGIPAIFAASRVRCPTDQSSNHMTAGFQKRRQLRADQTAGAGNHHGERSARAFFGMPPQVTCGAEVSVAKELLQVLPNVTRPQSAQWSEGNAIFDGIAKTT